MIDWRARRRWGTLVCLLACGCSTMREIPRGEYAAEPERENVKVETRSGTKYQFDRVQVKSDSLFGQQRVESEGSFEEYRTTSLSLDEVAAISVRKLDWYRIGLVAGVAAAVVLAAVLTQQKDDSTAPPSGGGCPKCP